MGWWKRLWFCSFLASWFMGENDGAEYFDFDLYYDVKYKVEERWRILTGCTIIRRGPDRVTVVDGCKNEMNIETNVVDIFLQPNHTMAAERNT